MDPIITTTDDKVRNTREQNLQLQREEFLAGKTILKNVPSELALVLGLRCNSACKTCVMGTKEFKARLKEPQPRLTSAEWEELRYFVANYLYFLSLSGGEPLVYKLTHDILRLSAEHPELTVQFATNALHITDTVFEYLRVGKRRLSISMDVVSPEVYQRIRGQDILLVRESVAKLSQMASVELVSNFVLQVANADDLVPFIRWASDNRFSSVSVQVMTHQGKFMDKRFAENDMLADDERLRHAIDVIGAATQVAQSLGVSFFHNLQGEMKHRSLDAARIELVPESPPREWPSWRHPSLSCATMWIRIENSPTNMKSTCFCQNRIPRGPEQGVLIRDAWNCPAFVKARRDFVRKRFGNCCKDNCVSIARLKAGFADPKQPLVARISQWRIRGGAPGL